MKTLFQIYSLFVALTFFVLCAVFGCGKEPSPIPPIPDGRSFSFKVTEQVSVVGVSDEPAIEKAKIEGIILSSE